MWMDLRNELREERRGGGQVGGAEGRGQVGGAEGRGQVGGAEGRDRSVTRGESQVSNECLMTA